MELVVARRDHPALDRGQMMAVEERHGGELAERAHPDAVVARPQRGAAVLHQDEAEALLQAQDRRHVGRHPEHVDDDDGPRPLAPEDLLQVVAVEAEGRRIRLAHDRLHAELDGRRHRGRPAHGRHHHLQVRQAARREQPVVHEEIRRGAGVHEDGVTRAQPFAPRALELPHQRALGQPGVGAEPSDQVPQVVAVDRLVGEAIFVRHQNGPRNASISGDSPGGGLHAGPRSCTSRYAVEAMRAGSG